MGKKQITIEVGHPQTDYQGSNAYYIPESDNNPRVVIHQGNMGVLQNIETDADVIYHELAHHAIFHFLKSTQQVETTDGRNENHSLAIHEGL